MATGDSRGIDVFVLGSSVMSPAALSCVYDTHWVPDTRRGGLCCFLLCELDYRKAVITHWLIRSVDSLSLELDSVCGVV